MLKQFTIKLRSPTLSPISFHCIIFCFDLPQWNATMSLSVFSDGVSGG